MRRHLCPFPIALLIFSSLSCCLFPARFAAGEDLVQRYYHGLRDRGLYLLAEDELLNELSRAQLTADQQFSLTMELVRTLSEHAATLQGDERQELWGEAKDALERLRSQATSPERILIVDAEFAAIAALQAEAIVSDFQIYPEEILLRNEALTALQQAVEELQKVDLHFDQDQPDSLKDLTSQQKKVHNRTHYLLAKVMVLREELSTDSLQVDSPALSDAASYLQQIEGKLLEKTLQANASVLLARIFRYRGDFESARSQLSQVDEAKFSSTDRDHLLAEKLRLKLAEGDPHLAIELIASRYQQRTALSDELRATSVDVLLDAWKIAQQQGAVARQQQLMREAESQAAQAEGRWKLLAESRIARFHQEQKIGSELAAIVRQAQSEWRAGQTEAALQSFATATALAAESGQQDLAAEYAQTRASILLNNQRWREAAAAFGKVASQFSETPRAAEADLLRCYALGKQFSVSGTEDDRQFYEQSLKNHLASYPESSTRFESLWMQANSEEQLKNWTQSIAYYQQIPEFHERFAEARYRITLLAEQLRHQSGQQLGQLEALKIAMPIANDLVQRRQWLSAVECQTLLQIARLLLTQSPPDYDQAEELLSHVNKSLEQEKNRVEESAGDLHQSWQPVENSVMQLRIVSLAGQRRLEEARVLLIRMNLADPLSMLPVLAGLGELSETIDADRRREFGYLMRTASQQLSESDTALNPDQLLLLQETAAQAEAAIGDYQRAAEIYEQLLKDFPRHRRLMHGLIKVYGMKGQPAELQKAYALWVQIEKEERTGTPAWVEARLCMAELLQREGKFDDAQKLLGVTLTLYPQMGTPELKARAEQLLITLGKSPPQT